MKTTFRYAGYALALGSLLFTSCQDDIDISSTLTNAASKEATVLNYVPNEMLIKFKPNIDSTKKADVIAKLGGVVKEKILTKLMEQLGDSNGLLLVQLPANALNGIAKAKGLSEIEYAEPNFIYQHSATSNDPYVLNGSLWGMYGAATSPSNTYGIDAITPWANGKTGASTNPVYIGIIDEGYMYTHEDLAANVGKNPGEIEGNRKDDDRNGLVDDVYGWDFANGDKTIFDGVSDDHGTHVAGTIGAKGGNSIGVAGVSWNVRFISAKFLGATGGTTANAIKAVDYITNLKIKQKLNIVATNNSWGGGGFSQSLQDAISRANNAGILFIAAAGNNSSNNDVTANYPSNYPVANVIAVAALTSTGALASFSNYGATKVHLGAPGAAILSTVPAASGTQVVSGYASYNGTSMATPHVTGAVALYASINPSASIATIKNAILSSTVATPSLTGKCITGGRLTVTSF